MSREFEDDVLRALRRITRAIDLHSRYLATTFGLTGPQLVCLRVIGERGPLNASHLAREVSLSQGTITGIVDRLVTRQLVERERNSPDRRVVTVSITPAGKSLVEAAPSPLQERFVERLMQLSERERTTIAETLTQIVHLMDGDTLDAAPMLAPGASLSSVPDVVEPGDDDIG
jgi:DNA-binding MarR family transcriptional regulator